MIIHSHVRHPGRRGLLGGLATYSYLPFACRVGRIRFALSYTGEGGSSIGAVVQLEQNAAPLGDPMSLSLGVSDIFEPDTTTVIPGVDATNLDDDAKLSLNATIFAPSAGSATLRYAVELIPTDPTLADAEIWSLAGTGEDGSEAILFGMMFGGGVFVWQNGPGDEVYCNGYVQGQGDSSVFNTLASGSEDSITGLMQSVGFKFGVATPLARQCVFSHLMCVSADPTGFDGVYDFSIRRDSNSVLTVTTPTDGSRIASVGGTATIAESRFWNWMAVGNPGGMKVIGHLLCAVRPSAEGGEAGLGAFGLGQRGLGG